MLSGRTVATGGAVRVNEAGPRFASSRAPSSGASWYRLWAPKDLPADITVKILARPDANARLTALGFEAIGSTPDYSAKYIASEMDKYGKIIRDANIKAE